MKPFNGSWRFASQSPDLTPVILRITTTILEISPWRP
jgi:hypothetical protein